MNREATQKSSLSPLVKVLAFFAALRNYGYVDRLGNALDPITAYEAIRDAIRDFDSACIASDKKVHEAQEFLVKCPEVTSEEVDAAVRFFERLTGFGSGAELVRVTREVAMEAMAMAGSLRITREEGE